VRYGEWYAHQAAEATSVKDAAARAMRACLGVMRQTGSGFSRRWTPRSWSFVFTTRVVRPGFAAL